MFHWHDIQKAKNITDTKNFQSLKTFKNEKQNQYNILLFFLLFLSIKSDNQRWNIKTFLPAMVLWLMIPRERLEKSSGRLTTRLWSPWQEIWFNNQDGDFDLGLWLVWVLLLPWLALVSVRFAVFFCLVGVLFFSVFGALLFALLSLLGLRGPPLGCCSLVCWLFAFNKFCCSKKKKSGQSRSASRGIKRQNSGYCVEDPIRTVMFLGSWNHT